MLVPKMVQKGTVFRGSFPGFGGFFVGSGSRRPLDEIWNQNGAILGLLASIWNQNVAIMEVHGAVMPALGAQMKSFWEPFLVVKS